MNPRQKKPPTTVSRVFPKENNPPTHQVSLFTPLLNALSVKACSSEWFPPSRLITLHISTLNSILPFVSRVIEEILALVNLNMLCPAIHRILSSQGPVQSCSNSPDSSSAHAQCSWAAGWLFTGCSKHRLLWPWGWQPLVTAPEHLWLLTLLTSAPIQQRHERTPGWPGWEVRRGSC